MVNICDVIFFASVIMCFLSESFVVKSHSFSFLFLPMIGDLRVFVVKISQSISRRDY